MYTLKRSLTGAPYSHNTRCDKLFYYIQLEENGTKYLATQIVLLKVCSLSENNE